MSKNINYNSPKLKYIVCCTLLTQLHAQSYQNILQKNPKQIEIKASSFDNFSIKKRNNIKKITAIKSISELFSELKIEKALSILKDKKIQKILSDININDYTLTYLLYNKVTNQIENINIGGENIALIHIKTTSLNDYQKTQKLLGKKEIPWKDIDKFEKKLQTIIQTHLVTFKNIIISDKTLFTANTIQTLISSIKSFDKDITNHERACNPHRKEDTNTTLITTYLSAIQSRNNLEYIRRNPSEFSNTLNIATLSKKITKLLTKIEKDDTNNTNLDLQNNIKYPKRYTACSKNKPIKIEPFNLPSKKIEKKYQKILENTTLSLHYDFKIEPNNDGKVILLKWVKTIKQNDKLIHLKENSKILLDSYINYKALKVSKIDGLNYGSINFKTPFDAYEKHKTIQGFGIIESAICGYEIKDKNGTFEFDCKDIKLKDLDIKFEHAE